MYPHACQLINGSECSIEVGTTGTISNLISQELGSMKHKPQASSSSGKKLQAPPVSVACGSTHKKLQQKRNPFNDSGSNKSSNSNSRSVHPGQEKLHKQRQSTQKYGSQIPMLGSEDIIPDRNPNGKRIAKKGHAYIVEVVDIKCDNAVSGRLKKLGFSKLSESII